MALMLTSISDRTFLYPCRWCCLVNSGNSDVSDLASRSLALLADKSETRCVLHLGPSLDLPTTAIKPLQRAKRWWPVTHKAAARLGYSHMAYIRPCEVTDRSCGVLPHSATQRLNLRLIQCRLTQRIGFDKLGFTVES